MKIVAAFLGAASLLSMASSAAPAQNVRAQPLGLASSGIEASDIAFGCGPGFVPNRFGVCRPRFYGGGYGYGRPYGFGGYGYGYGRGRDYGYRPYGYRRFGYY